MRTYIAHMAIIYDFTEFKLHQLMERASEAQRHDLAEWYFTVLSEYLAGNMLILFENGEPTISAPEP